VKVPSQVQQFLERQLLADGHAPLSEAKMNALHNPERWMMIADEDGVVAVGVVATHRQRDSSLHWTFETAVDRSMRFPAFEDKVVSEVLALVPPGAETSGWSRRPSLDASLERFGFSVVRSLSEMSVTLPVESSPTVTEQDFVVRRFNDDDVETLVSINAAAFGDHREAGSLDRGEVESLMAEPWFDPEGLLFHEAGGVVAGFCWTKVHDNGEGEIYRIGVDPQFHSAGIGRRIVLAGLEYLATKRGCSTGFLWVDEANAPAMGLYDAIGLTTRSRNREFSPALTTSNGR
jgi:mycothiol synthase